MNQLYRAMNISKQSFHQYHNRLLKRMEQDAYLLKIINQVREGHPTMGCRDMYYLIQPEGIGRDLFEAFCKDSGLLVKRAKNYRRTTDSSGVKRFDNLTIDLTVTKLNQLWVSDITYYQVGEVFYYLTFIMDKCSRRIIGHKTSTRLLTSHSTQPALEMALKTRKNQSIKGVILHSDGGGQYYADAFLELTQKSGIQNSMCIYPWENPHAERINGVIKNNYLKHRSIQSYAELVKEVDRAVKLYNEEKPHIGLQRISPINFEKTIFAIGKRNGDEESTEKIKSKAWRGVSPPGLRKKETKTSDVTKKIKLNLN
jgi:putative transposase